MKAVTQHNFAETFEKFVGGFSEIMKRNLWGVRAKLLPKATCECRSFIYGARARGWLVVLGVFVEP